MFPSSRSHSTKIRRIDEFCCETSKIQRLRRRLLTSTDTITSLLETIKQYADKNACRKHSYEERKDFLIELASRLQYIHITVLKRLGNDIFMHYNEVYMSPYFMTDTRQSKENFFSSYKKVAIALDDQNQTNIKHEELNDNLFRKSYIRDIFMSDD
ncbi:unnamed protein product, partial [Didymodactylos carnosus]